MVQPREVGRGVGVASRILICAGIVVLWLAVYRVDRPIVARAASVRAAPDTTQVYLDKIPAGYRDWPVISLATIGFPLYDIRAKLGNNLAINAYRSGKIPFPDGAIIARLAWKQDTSADNNNAFRLARGGKVSADALDKMLSQSFVAGSPTNIQFMVKDSRKYASTGGWGFGQFTNGKPDTGVVMTTCFACHAPAKDRDFLFTRYAP
jgi:hypothetical protein